MQVATLLGFVHDGTPLPMAIMTACVCAVAVVVHFALVSCEARAQQEVLKYRDFDGYEGSPDEPETIQYKARTAAK